MSVVVPTYDGAETLRTTIEALNRQTVPDGSYEIIVVDDASTDDSALVAEAAGARVIRQPANRGAGAARNAGVRAARAPLVAFIDDDCTAEPGWLAELIEPLSDPAVDGAGGQIVPHADDGLVSRYIAARNPWKPLSAELLESASPAYRLRLYLRGLLETEAGDEEAGCDLFAVAGANMAFRTEVLNGLGGFDETYRVSEETELCRRLHSRPGRSRIVYRPSAKVHHRFHPSLRGILRRARWYGEGNARFAAEHEDVRLIVFPFPVLLAAAFLAALLTRRRGLAAAVPFLPPLAYVGWLKRALSRRELEPLAYPYLQMAQELATMAGEASVALRGRR
ncbi:MAG TPA: glycosyltransferase [Thermoleophilaceae bacterium]|nr:glycosyltransferase [Thermoleophilaceae bacterium]